MNTNQGPGVGDITYTVGHFFAGAGGAVNGYSRAIVEAVGIRARFETVLAVDCWDVALETCRRMNGGPIHLYDLFDEDTYTAYHGHPPPEDWRPMTPADLRAICPKAPDVIVSSPPCKANSSLISAANAASAKYVALNTLVARWLWLCLEAWPDAPPRLILMENVPGIADVRRRKRKRGEDIVERAEKLLRAYGYSATRSTHDCGPLGNLAQHRNRFLLTARHMERCPALLFEPFEVGMRTIGEVIGDLPMPCYASDIPMHELPSIQEKTAQRLAFVTPGKDWRSIEETWESAEGWTLAERDGLRYLVPTKGGRVDLGDPRTGQYHRGAYGVAQLEGVSGTITGGGRPANGRFSVADPRVETQYQQGVLGVRTEDETSGAVTGRTWPANGAYSVADPRLGRIAHNNVYRTADYEGPSPCVTGGATPTSGGVNVSDPRLTCSPNGATLRVVGADGQSPTITGTSGVWSTGSVQLADPRPSRGPRNGAFGVQDLDGKSCTITGSFDVHVGPAAVADQRAHLLVSPIISPWGTWNRPMTARELADLQSVPRIGVDGELLVFAGGVTDVRMQIGNMIPPDSARAIAEQMLRTLLVSDGVPVPVLASGIWVREGGVLRQYRTSRRQAPGRAVQVEGRI